nr:hypothetical protein [Tanacetum cinerariifolium]
MAFLSAVASRFPPSNNQIRTSSNPINQATIQDGRVTVQQVQRGQHQSYAGTGNRGITTISKGNIIVGPPRVVKCYKCQGEGHMARQYNLDAYDSDCDDLSSAKAVLMENLLSCDPEVLSEVAYSDSYPNDMISQDVQEMQYFEQTLVDDFEDNKIHSGGMFKLDIDTISARLKNTRDAHEVYLEKTIEYADTLCGLTCPNSPKPSEKLIVVTPTNKDKRVRFTEPVTSSNNITKQTDSLKTKYSNKPLLTSTKVKPTTSSSRSKPLGNTKNNRISRPPRSNQKNKVNDHPRTVKSSLNKTNFVSEPIINALIKHSVRNAKFQSMCAICNRCLFDANHDMCLVDFVNDVNVRSKSKSKRNKKRKAWKPRGKVFTNVGYKWKPTERFFTIVVDVVFDGAFRGVRDEEVVVGEGLDEEALVEFMVEWYEEDDDDDRNEGDDLFN